MTDHIPMIFLAIVLALALGVTAYLTLGNWRSSRTNTPQVAPEVVTKRWLNREARNARHENEPRRRSF